VLDADLLRRVSPAFGLVCRGEGGEDRDLVLPSGRPRREDRAGGLGAHCQALIAGVGQQGDPRGEGQQVHQAGLADLGQIVNGARTGLPAEQQPPLGVGDYQRLDGVGAGLAGNEPVPARPAGRGAAPSDLGGIEQAELPTGTEVGDDIGQGAQPEPVLDGAAALGRNGCTSLTARVIVERDTPNQQASTSWATPWRRCTAVASSRSVNTSRYRAPAPIARRRGRSASRASWRARQRGPAWRPAQPALPGAVRSPGDRRPRRLGQRPRHTTTLPRPAPQHGQAVGLTMHEVVSGVLVPTG
jgi:hypothetical protein